MATTYEPNNLYAKDGVGTYCIGELINVNVLQEREIIESECNIHTKCVAGLKNSKLRIQMYCNNQQINLLQHWFRDQKNIKYSVDFYKGTVLEFTAFLISTTVSLNSIIDIELIVFGKMDYVYKTKDIEEMSIYEIMEHVHKKLLIEDKGVKSIGQSE